MSSVGFGGFNRANQAAILQQQVADMRRAQSIFAQIGYVPQGGPVNQHGNVNKAVNLNGAKTFGSAGPAWAKGLGVDLNKDGKFTAGKDGQLALDLDGNGIYDQRDVRDTLKMLEMFSGKESKTSGIAGFGGFNQAEQAKLQLLKARGKQADLNQDGILSGWELNKMGAKVLVQDKSKKHAVRNYDGTVTAAGLRSRTVPGAFKPDYQPRPAYYPQPPIFGGYPSYGMPMGGYGGYGMGGGFSMGGYANPAFLMQMMGGMMGYFPSPY